LAPYIKAALAVNPDIRLFASPWSPPTWLKFPKTCSFGQVIWEPEHLEAYARYLYRFVDACRAEGIVVDQIHIQNEPRANQRFPSCVWPGEWLRDFIRDYAGPGFEKAGSECALPSSSE
jgi:glucosylceramidase